MKAIYIFGHRNPDTDSVCSAIGLSYLKNALGLKTIPRAIGHLNNETKFVLKYFNTPEPQYLNDVKVRIKNIKYDKKAVVYENSPIFNAYNVMQEQSITAVPITNEHKKLSGFVSMKDLAKFLVDGEKNIIDTTLDNILSVLKAEIVTKSDDIIKGNTMIVGYQSSTFHEEIELKESDILIIGNRYKVLEYAIESHVKLIVLALNNVISDELINKAKINNVTIIKTPLSSFEIANMISLSNYVKIINNCINPITVFDDDYYDEFQLIAKRTKHTNYPVINHKNECLGLISLNWSNDYEKQKVILVDHNNFEQSVEGIEESDIIEIIDHHNLGAINTSLPINFRSMPVGCTATMIYEMYNEKRIKIPESIAGLLLSAIISDTLLFTSPTTTSMDVLTSESLAKIANVDLNKYGIEMLKAASSVKDLTIHQQIYQDYKSYTVGNMHIGISQLVTLDFDEINKQIDKYVTELDEINASAPGVNVIFITDIIKKGSYVIYNTKSKDIIMDSFNLNNIEEGTFIPNIMSRKKQILPAIMEAMGKQ